VTLGLVEAMRRGLTRDAAFTEPDSDDGRLTGRTYAIPFDAVWEAATHLVGGGLPGWTVEAADDQEGVIEGVVTGRMERFRSGFRVAISLDQDAQTRVDAASALVRGGADLGVNARRIARFFRALDHRLESVHGRPMTGGRIDPAPWR
jgi:hypothetical protein